MRSLYFMSPHFHKSKINISSNLTKRILVFFFLIFRWEILQKWRSKNYFHFEKVKYWCLLKLQLNMYDIFLISNGRRALRIANSFINKNDKTVRAIRFSWIREKNSIFSHSIRPFTKIEQSFAFDEILAIYIRHDNNERNPQQSNRLSFLVHDDQPPFIPFDEFQWSY